MTQTHKHIYQFLYRISNTVGQTITEYHWREACELMKLMEDEEQGSGNNDNNSSSSQNQETHRDGSVTVVKTEN